MNPPAHSEPGPTTPQQPSTGDRVVSAPLLYTPAQAADKLAISESWLRRKAGLRLIPCTFVGKHLRFSDADLHAILALGSRPTSAHPQHTRRRKRRRSP